MRHKGTATLPWMTDNSSLAMMDLWHWLGEMSAGHQHRHWNSQMFPPYHSFVAVESNISSHSSVFFSWRWLVFKNPFSQEALPCYHPSKWLRVCESQQRRNASTQRDGPRISLFWSCKSKSPNWGNIWKYVFKNRSNETWRSVFRCFIQLPAVSNPPSQQPTFGALANCPSTVA